MLSLSPDFIRTAFYPLSSGISNLSVPDKTIIQTFGHSVSGVGPAVYRYDANSSSTVNSGTVHNGPGGVGRYHLLDDAYQIDITKWGARGDAVTDDTAAINRAISYAGSIATTARRPVLYFPPKTYKITNLDIPNNIDVYMPGASLISSSIDQTRPILSIGASGSNVQGNYIGLRVEFDGTPTTHGYNPSGINDYYGIRILNSMNGNIDVKLVNGFYGGLQLLSSGQGGIAIPCAHNHVQLGAFYTCKIGVDLRAWGTGYTNENLFYGGNHQTGSTMNLYGSCYGIRFSHAPSGYTQQNNNVFVKPCFQLGSGRTTWASGLGVSRNYRLYYDGREYRVLDNGTAGGIPPTHTSGIASDGSLNLEYVGNFRKAAVWHNDAGNQCSFYSARWESALGAFAVIDGTVSTPSVYEYEYYGDIGSGNALRHIEDLEGASSITIQSASSPFIQSTQAYRSNQDHVHGLHHRAIGSASGWTVAGLGIYGVFSSAFTTTSSFPNAWALCRDGLYFDTYPDLPHVIVDVTRCHRFRIDRNSFDNLGRIICIPMDDSFTRMDFASGTTPNSPFLLGSSIGVSAINDQDAIQTTSDTNASMTVVCHPSVAYVLVGFTSCKLEGFDITKQSDTYNDGDINLFLNGAQFGDSQRQSFGTPTKGFFQKRGEIITNTHAGTGNVSYWIVTTPGILAPAFPATTAVIKGQLCSNGGNVYAVNSAGTTGSTAPTGTIPNVSDGTLLWDYIGTSATLTAGPVL